MKMMEKRGLAERAARFQTVCCHWTILVMAIDPEELRPAKKLPDIVLGEDISALSAHELEARIMRLEEEVARCKAAIEARHATRSAAESFFKR
jgi:uncharacterized small protein (DUF1192 family)